MSLLSYLYTSLTRTRAHQNLMMFCELKISHNVIELHGYEKKIGMFGILPFTGKNASYSNTETPFYIYPLCIQRIRFRFISLQCHPTVLLQDIKNDVLGIHQCN